MAIVVRKQDNGDSIVHHYASGQVSLANGIKEICGL